MPPSPHPSRARRVLAVVGYLAVAGACLVALLPVALIFFWSVGAQHHPENYVGGAVVFGLVGLALIAGTGWGLWRAFLAATARDGAVDGRRVLPVVAGIVAAALLFFLLGVVF